MGRCPNRSLPALAPSQGSCSPEAMALAAGVAPVDGQGVAAAPGWDPDLEDVRVGETGAPSRKDLMEEVIYVEARARVVKRGRLLDDCPHAAV